MTKEDFMKSCLAEYRCMPDAAECWCSWADTLHECDSAKADPETGEVEDGEGPVITAEEFLDQFIERMEVMAYAYGIETVTTTLFKILFHPINQSPDSKDTTMATIMMLPNRTLPLVQD